MPHTEVHHKAYKYIRSLVNSRQRGRDIDRNEFVSFVRNVQNQPAVLPMDDAKREYVISDFSKSKIVEKILSINPSEVIADKNTLLVERHDDAINILNKYYSLDSCVVCDNHIFSGSELLNRKKENRKCIYENLDEKTKNILDKIVCDDSLVGADLFEIKRIVGTFISNGDSTELLLLQQTLRDYVNSIGNQMIALLYHCFDGTALFNDFDEHERLTSMQPQLDSEELLFIENQQIKILKQRLEDVEGFYTNIRKVRHEMRNHMTNIKGLVSKEEYREVENYIQALDTSMQDLEYRFWELSNGGKIQYVKYPIDYNMEAIKTLIRRAMELGFYEGVNLSLAYCDDCGHQELEMDVCPACGSKNLTKIDRMNGYLSYSRVHGDTRLNEAKMAEIAERKSM